jgi:hypothetical protein
LNREYCCKNCQIGRAAKDLYLKLNESVFKAAFEFDSFVENCFKLCPLKAEHSENISTHKEIQK